MRIPLTGPAWALAIATALVALLVSLHVATMEPPDPVPASAAPTDFSAERAGARLRDTLREDTPHPVASEEQHRVRERISAALRALGLDPEIQRTFACSARYESCAPVENLLALLPGTGSEPLILVMAHYDSVPAAPGAGDDGAAVATLLESARALLAGPPRRNSVLFLFTDAEEIGLVGAEAFFELRPEASRIALVINLEGSGTAGRSMLLRTGPGSGWLVDRYRAVAPAPVALSSTNEIFKWLPNDTDFSVAMARGLPGLDFVFAGERSHYHTPLDRVANLDSRTLQHHGDNLLPLLRRLVQEPLEASGDEAYYTLYQRLWITWPLAMTPFLATLLLLCAVVLCYRGLSTRMYTGREFARAALVCCAVLAGVIGADALAYAVLSLLRGTIPDWPAHPAPLQTALAGTSLFTALQIVAALGKATSPRALLCAQALIFCAVAVLPAWLAPYTANTFVIPAAAMCLIVTITLYRWPWPVLVERFATIALPLVCTPFTLGVLVEAEPSLGYRSWPIGFPFYGLFAVSACALIASFSARHGVRSLSALCGGVALSGCILVFALPYHSDWRPQPIDVVLAEDAASGTASWIALSPEPVPRPLLDAFDFTEDGDPALPWLERPAGPRAPAPASGLPPPELTVLEAKPTPAGREVRLRFRSPRHARESWILFPRDHAPLRLRIDGATLQLHPHPLPGVARIAGNSSLVRLCGVPGEGVVVTAEFSETAPVAAWIADWSDATAIDAAPLRAARDLVGVPFEQGDGALIFAQVAI